MTSAPSARTARSFGIFPKNRPKANEIFDRWSLSGSTVMWNRGPQLLSQLNLDSDPMRVFSSYRTPAIRFSQSVGLQESERNSARW